MKTLDTWLFRSTKLFGSLSENEIMSIIKAQENGTHDYPSNHVLYRERDPGDYMYIVLDGAVELFVKGEMGRLDNRIATIREGGHFGESVVMTNKTGSYQATACTTVPSTLFKVHKKSVFTLLNEGREAFPPDKVRDLVLKIPLFKGLNREELRTVKEWAPLKDYKAGDCIYQAGQAADGMYLMQDGRVELYLADAGGNLVLAASEGPGEYFGEEALIPGGNDQYLNLAKAITDARVIKIPAAVFKSLLQRDPKLIDNIKMVQNLRKLKLQKPRTGTGQHYTRK